MALDPPTPSSPPHARARSVRAKRLLGLKNINVYALGLYVDAPAAKRALAKHKPAAGTAPSQSLYDGQRRRGEGGGGGSGGAPVCAFTAFSMTW